MLFDFALSGLLFLPGILILTALSKRVQLNVLEKILFGSVLWNYFFISISVFLGSFTNLLVSFFRFFQIIAIAAMMVSITFIMKNRSRNPTTENKPIRLNLEILPYLLVSLAILSLCFVLTYFHTVFVEWDAISYYIPSSKAILASQGLTSQPYRLLNFFDVSPGIVIIYAWILSISSVDNLYSLPIIFFVLTTIAVLLISKRLFSNRGTIIPCLIFMSLPTVLVTIGSRALYLDVPFVLFFFSMLYSAIRIIDATKSGHSTEFDYAMFFIGLALMCLTRIEFGIFLVPVAVATVVFTFKLKYWRIISASTLGAVFYLREMRNIFLDPQFSLLYLQRLTPVLIVSAIIYVILKRVSINRDVTDRPINKKIFTATLLLLVPFLAYILRNITVSGFVVPELPLSNPDIFESIGVFNRIYPSSTTSWIESLRWDNLVSVWWLVSPYLIPIAVSLFVLIYGLLRKRSLKRFFVPAIISFAGLFILWSVLSCDPQPRRLYYFAPFIAILASQGMLTVGRHFSSLGFTLRIPTYVISITGYSLVKIGVGTVNDAALFYGQLYQPIADIEFVVVCAAIFLLIFLPYETLTTKIRKNIEFPRSTSRAIILSTVGLNTILIVTMISPIVSAASGIGYQSRRQDYSGWYYYPDVVNYYIENVHDKGTTIGFFCNELITFADRSTIDLFDPIYGMPLYSIMNHANETQILDRIKELNVEYLLTPRKGTSFYPFYEKLVDSTILGNILTDNPQFSALRTFKYATLYKFHENYTASQINYSRITPWNYDPEEDHTLTSEHDITKFSATTNPAGRISIMYTFEQPTNLTNALWLTIISHDYSELVVTIFSNLQNRTTDYVAFKYQLANETRRPVISPNEGSIKGAFNPNHVEGILVGIETEPNRIEILEISGLYSITYKDT